MCVYIATRFLDCVRPVGPLFSLLIVARLRYGQRSPLYVWFVCFCRMTAFRIHLEDHVTVKTVRNKRDNTLCDVLQRAGLHAPPIGTRGRTIVCFGRIGIPYKCPVFAGRDSLDNKPVTGSLHFAAPGCRLAEFIAEGLVLCLLRGSADYLQFVRQQMADLVSTSACSWRFHGTLRRHMCSWICTEYTILQQFRTFWTCIPNDRKRLLSRVCSAGLPAVFVH